MPRINSYPLPPELKSVDSRLLMSGIRPPQTLIRKEGWRAYVNRGHVAPPPVLDPKLVAGWSKEQQKQYAALRKRFHSIKPPLSTPALSDFSKGILDMALRAIDMSPGVRFGALINGMPTLGKSTILTEIGRRFERLLRARISSAGDGDDDVEFTPVVYATLTANETSEGLTQKLLDFYCYPYSPNDSPSRLFGLLADHAGLAGTGLFLIDDIHFLNPRQKTGRDVNTHLKALASSINATFVYAGVHIDSTGLLFEGRPAEEAYAAQTQRRFKRLDLQPFECGAPDFIAVLQALEKQLVLLHAQPGDMLALADYVHKRTDGYMGPITSLLRDGAAAAIDCGTERLTKTILDKVQLDHASERRYQKLSA